MADIRLPPGYTLEQGVQLPPGYKLETAATPAAPSGPSPLSKAWTAFGETSGVRAMLDIMGGASRDPVLAQKAIDTIKALGAGILHEPARIAGEVAAGSQATTPGSTFYHYLGAVPFVGAGAQTVMDDISRGDPAAAVGHTAGLAVPFLAKGAGTVAERALPGIQTAAEATAAAAAPVVEALGKAGTATSGAARAMVGAAPEIAGGALEGAGLGLLGGPGGVVIGAKIGAARAARPIALRGAREALAERAAQAAALKAAEAAPPPETPAAAPAAPAAVPFAEQTAIEPSVPQEPVAQSPSQERPALDPAAALEASMRPDRLADYLLANKIPGAMVDQFGPHEWQMIADQARTMPPTAEDIAAVRSKIGEYEGAAAMPANVSPADAAVEFQKRRGIRRRTSPEPALPAPEAAAVIPPAAAPLPPGVDPAQALAEMMPEHAAAPPGPDVPAPTAGELRVEALAKTLAAGDIPTSELAKIETIPGATILLEDLARSLGEARPAPGEIPQIVERVRQIRGEAKEPQATIASDASETSGGPPVPRTPTEASEPAQAVEGTPPEARPGISGTATSIRIPGEQDTYRARYLVRELDDVQPSHNPHTFQPNGKYGIRNDRNYGDPANQERIVLDSQPGRFVPEYLITDSPDAVNGPPVTDPSGNVLGGNSRVMKLARVYANNPQDAAAYRALLEQQASRFGIDPASIAQMKRPVLVRELSESTANPQRLVTDLNKSGTAALTGAERATADARRMSAGAAEYLSKVIEAEGPDATLNDALTGKNGAKIINQLVNDGVFTMQEKPALVDSKTGAITAAAKERISKMLLGQVFADSDQMIRTPAEIRNKLERVVSPLLQSAQKTGFNLLPTVRQSLDLLEYARAHGITRLEDALAQESMFGNAPTFSPEAVQLGEFLRGEKPTKIAAAFRRYVANAEPTMFGESTPAEAFADAFGSEPQSLGEMMQPKPPQSARKSR